MKNILKSIKELSENLKDLLSIYAKNNEQYKINDVVLYLDYGMYEIGVISDVELEKIGGSVIEYKITDPVYNTTLSVYKDQIKKKIESPILNEQISELNKIREEKNKIAEKYINQCKEIISQDTYVK